MSIIERIRRRFRRGTWQRVVEDPVFSCLYRVSARAPATDYWEGSARLASVGEIEVFIDAGGDAPSEEQRAFFRTMDVSIEQQCTEIVARAREARGVSALGAPRPVWIAIPEHPTSQDVEIGLEVGGSDGARIVGRYARGRLVDVNLET